MRRHPVLLGLVIALVAFNLRPALASVGPVLPELRAGLRLSGPATAVLTTLPVLCFAALSTAAPRLARRAGMGPVLMVALLALLLGLLARVAAGPILLFAATAVVGGAIAVGNVLLPPLIKRDFPRHTGAMMGVYTMFVAGSAAVAAGVTVPASTAFGWDWRGGLALWALPAALAVLGWLPLAGDRSRPPAAPGPVASLARSALAWQVTVFFGLQSMLFYALLAWLPSIYRDHGYSPAAAGFLLSLLGLVQIPVTLVLPGIAARARNQILPIVLATAVFGAGLVGLLLAPTVLPYLWVTLAGVGSGACFALALALFVLRAGQVQETARLSGMAQSAGYLISACGPLLFGLVHDATGAWTAPLAMLVLLLAPQLWCGVLAGRARTVSGPAAVADGATDGVAAVTDGARRATDR